MTVFNTASIGLLKETVESHQILAIRSAALEVRSPVLKGSAAAFYPLIAAVEARRKLLISSPVKYERERSTGLVVWFRCEKSSDGTDGIA